MAFIAKSAVELEPLYLHHGDLLRFGGGKRQADKYEMFVYRVDATAFPQLSRQASHQPSPTPPNRSSSSPAPISRANSEVLAPDSRPTVPAGPPAGPPVGPPMWRWQSDKASDVWSPYAAAQCAVIERAWQRSEKQVRLDAERTLDLVYMRQFRDDAPSRTRRVRRDPPHASPLLPPDGGTPAGRKRDRDVDGGGDGDGDGDGGGGGGGGGGGAVSPGADATRVRVLPDLAPAKRATVRIVTLVRSTGQVLSAGSGCIVSRDGHVLTAAHLFINPRNGRPELFGGKHPVADVVLAVAVYDADALASRWSYWAELQTPLEILQVACNRVHPPCNRVHPACSRVRPAICVGTAALHSHHRSVTRSVACSTSPSCASEARPRSQPCACIQAATPMHSGCKPSYSRHARAGASLLHRHDHALHRREGGRRGAAAVQRHAAAGPAGGRHQRQPAARPGLAVA